MAVDYSVRDGVAVLALDHPPVNGLGFALRLGIAEGLERAQRDPDVRAIVLVGARKVFSGGADITEFNTPNAMREPSLATLIENIERSAKPVIAAIHGTAMGGGLELALAAHYRIVAPGTQLALPEVKLGLLPGAGGTQRLPRAVGLETALNMIVSGTPVPAEQLVSSGLFERLTEGDFAAAVHAFALEVAGRAAPHPRLRDRAVTHENAAGYLQFARNSARAAAPQYPAPQRCIDAIEAGVLHGFERGSQVEREGFLALVESPESHALRHAFFGERAASKIADVPADTPVRDIKSVGVIGAGTMGGGIAMNFLNVGLPVTLLETRQDALDRGLATIRKNYEAQVRKGKLTQEKLDTRMGLLRPTLSYDDLAQADLIIEAVFEELGVKEQVFRTLDKIAKPGAILASNTSTLDLNKISGFTHRPEDVVGLHFFSPANVMKLLEVVRGYATANDVLATVMQLAKKIRKTAVVSGVCDGFIGNRMVEQYIRQALFMLEEGALPAQIDGAIERFGFAMGPFRMSDLAGNDIGWAIRKRRYSEQPDMRYSKVADRLCELGRFGQKTGAGWYDYAEGDRRARPSQLVNEMIVAYSNEHGVARRVIDDEEIVERLVYALVNEGAKILEEKIAAKASDVDMVYLTGYGFPLWRGGPMFYADTVGLYKVERAMRRYAEGVNGEAWQIAPSIVELSRSGGRFNA